MAKFNALIPEVSRLDRQYEIVLDQVLSVHQKCAKSLNEDASSHFVSGLVIIAAIACLFVVVIVAVNLLMKPLYCAGKPGARALQPDCGRHSWTFLCRSRGAHNESIDRSYELSEQMRRAPAGISPSARRASHTVARGAGSFSGISTGVIPTTGFRVEAQTAASMEELSATVANNTDNVYQAGETGAGRGEKCPHR